AICYLLDMVTRKKVKMTRPEWIFEWLNRHQSAFVDKSKLQTFFTLLGMAAAQGWLPRPAQEDAKTLSSLIARLCQNGQINASAEQSSEQIHTERILVLDALTTFAAIVKHADLSPLSKEEMQAINQLLEKLHTLSPGTKEIEKAMMAMMHLTKTHSVKQLKPVEKPLFSLLEHAGTHIAAMSCLRRGTYTFKILKRFTDADEPSTTSKVVPQAFLRHLATLASPSSEELADDDRIAASFHLAGLYCDLTEGEDLSAILKTLRALADQTDPSHPHERLSWNDLISILCLHFVQFDSTPHAINHFLFGLATMAFHGLFTGFHPGAGMSVDRVLEKYVSAAENPEEDLACEVTADTLIWISHLAKRRHLTKHPSIDTLIKLIPDDAPHRILLSTFLSLGKLAANGCALLLSAAGSRHLDRLVQKTLEEACKDSSETCPDFLYALGSFINSRVIAPEAASLHEPLFRRLIKNALKYPVKNAKQACQLLFFIDALPDCSPDHGLQTLRQRLHCYLVARQLEGPRASFKRKQSGSELLSKKSKMAHHTAHVISC
ncbi:MAG: hypothetical protein LLG04_04355, partial [Parachlamydia sp.]|nr:hypothetical protein [Parachlamydia sp.]